MSLPKTIITPIPCNPDKPLESRWRVHTDFTNARIRRALFGLVWVFARRVTGKSMPLPKRIWWPTVWTKCRFELSIDPDQNKISNPLRMPHLFRDCDFKMPIPAYGAPFYVNKIGGAR